MINIDEISEENVEDYLPLLGEDLKEDLRRIYYNGLGATDEDGSVAGAFVYELLDSESEDDTKSRICLFKTRDEETSDSLFEHYSRNCVDEEEIVESFYEFKSEKDASLLSSKGFSKEKREAEALTITLKELSETALGKKKSIPDHIGNIEQLSILQFRDAVKQILFKGHKGVIEDIPFLPKTWFENSLSACVSSGGKFPGLFLIRKTPSGVLIPVLLFAYGPEYQKNVGLMLQYSAQQAIKLYPPETIIQIPRKNAETRSLTDKLLANYSGTEIFFGSRKEGN